MAKEKIPNPKDIKAAAQAAVETAQAAVETAQAAAVGAMRIPPATVALVAELPDLIEILAKATERLNATIDRAERYFALADPMVRTMDAMLPQLEALVATGNDVFRAAASVPGVSTLGRFATRGTQPPPETKPPKPRKPKT